MPDKEILNDFVHFDSDIIDSQTPVLPIRIITYSDNYDQTPWRYKRGSTRTHIYYIERGKGAVECGGKKLTFGPGDFMLFRSNVPVSYYPLGKLYHGKFFTFMGSAAESLLDYYNVPECAVIKSERLLKSFEKIFTYINNHLEIEHLSSKLYSFVTELGIAYRSSEKKGSFEQAIAYIDNHYYHNISVRDIAEAVNISESALYKQFKNKLVLSPGAYINSLRIKWAKYYLISEPDISSEQIGTMVGFHSPSYFIECFKNLEGVTPHQFRKLKNESSE